MKLIDTFLELAAIDNVHPYEDDVRKYIRSRLDDAGVESVVDDFGNVVALLGAEIEGTVLGLCGHMDIAAPLNDREIVIEDDIIKTDGTALLGGDDKTAVAAMLTLASDVADGEVNLTRPVELLFTVGEEAGLLGAKNLDYSLLKSKDYLVLDWMGPVNSLITRAPAYVKIDATVHGKQAHPAEWQDGINAGEILMNAVSNFTQGEVKPGVTFNVGKVEFGQARNQVPGTANLEAEMRSFELEKVVQAADEFKEYLQTLATDKGGSAEVELDSEAASFTLNKESELHGLVVQALEDQDISADYTDTYGCFDGNVMAGRGINIVILGAGYYAPHGPNEYLNIIEFKQMYEFISSFVSVD